MPTSVAEKVALAATSALIALASPERDDAVATLGETTGLGALVRLRDEMRATEQGREILATRPRVRPETVRPDALLALPEGSFGRAYAAFMQEHRWERSRGVLALERGRLLTAQPSAPAAARAVFRPRTGSQCTTLTTPSSRTSSSATARCTIFGTHSWACPPLCSVKCVPPAV